MIRPVSENATFALNSSGAWLIDCPRVTITGLSQYSEQSFSHRNPIFNINANIQPPSPSAASGGTIRNPYVTHPHPVNANNDILCCFNINTGNPNVKILGDYYRQNGGTTDGLIVMGNWRSPSTNHGALAVNSTGEDTYVEGIRIQGSCRRDDAFQNITLNGARIRAVNCIADATSGADRTRFTNCITNRAWLAKGGN